MVRVAVDQLGSTEPSSSPAPRRFSPLRDENSRRVPVLYTGADLACALGETVFHDLGDDPSSPAEVFRADLLALRAATIAVTIDCQVADLTDEALTRYGYRRDEVIDTTAEDYPITRRWGQHAWDTTGCAGLVLEQAAAVPNDFRLCSSSTRPACCRPGLGRWSRRQRLDVRRSTESLSTTATALAAVMVAAAERNVTIIV